MASKNIYSKWVSGNLYFYDKNNNEICHLDGVLDQFVFKQLLVEPSQDAIAAFAGGGQAGAIALTKEMNRITTVASAGDSVKLPVSYGGLTILVENGAVLPMQVFGAGADTINGVATATGVSQMPGSVVLFTCYTAGSWFTEGLSTGFAGGLQTVSTKDAITAFAGGGQGSATLLAALYNRATTVASAGDSVKLPVSAQGLQITVTNAHATNSMNVFPNTGDAINALGANAAFALAATKTAQFLCSASGQWHSLLSA